MSPVSSALKQRIYRGMKEYFIVTAYLWLIFALFDLYRSVLVAQYHIDVVAKGFAIINAMALAKVALLAREFKLDARLRPKGRPLIYSTLLNALGFALLMAAFKLLEEIAVGMYHGLSISASVEQVGGGSTRAIACLAGIFFVMLVPFCAFSELGIVLGEGRLRHVFFRAPELPPAGSHSATSLASKHK